MLYKFHPSAAFLCFLYEPIKLSAFMSVFHSVVLRILWRARETWYLPLSMSRANKDCFYLSRTIYVHISKITCFRYSLIHLFIRLLTFFPQWKEVSNAKLHPPLICKIKTSLRDYVILNGTMSH